MCILGRGWVLPTAISSAPGCTSETFGKEVKIHTCASSSGKDCSWSHGAAQMEITDRGCGSEAGHLVSMCEAFGSISSTQGGKGGLHSLNHKADAARGKHHGHGQGGGSGALGLRWTTARWSWAGTTLDGPASRQKVTQVSCLASVP